LEGGNNRDWISVNHGQQSARRGLGSASSSFPMLDGVEAESKGLRKRGLGHLQLRANSFDIYLLGNMHPKALLVAREACFHIVKTVHHLFEWGFHSYLLL
jgi:hypothetical protein